MEQTICRLCHKVIWGGGVTNDDDDAFHFACAEELEADRLSKSEV